jgi:hypothetical protein
MKLQNSVNNMHSSFNTEDIKTEIEKLRYMVTNIWNIKQYRTKLTLSMFSVDLKPTQNNKDIVTCSTEGRCYYTTLLSLLGNRG